LDKLTKQQRSLNMSKVRNKDSKIEILLRRELWSRGLHYQKNVKDIIGKPDIVFKGKKIAIFCDSEFWHGFDWDNKKFEIKSNREFWIKKIERNIQRDTEVNFLLTNDGWYVIRFWGNDIEKNVIACADQVEAVLKDR